MSDDQTDLEEISDTTNDEKDTTTTDYRDIFPANKIRASLRKEKDVGRITKKSIELVSLCSVFFIKQLVSDCISSSSSEKTKSKVTISLRDIKEAIEKKADKDYDFLAVSDVLQGIRDDRKRSAEKNSTAAPKSSKKHKSCVSKNDNQKMKNNTKSQKNNSQEDSLTETSIEKQIIDDNIPGTNRMSIIEEDEEDYDG